MYQDPGDLIEHSPHYSRSWSIFFSFLGWNSRTVRLRLPDRPPVSAHPLVQAVLQLLAAPLPQRRPRSSRPRSPAPERETVSGPVPRLPSPVLSPSSRSSTVFRAGRSYLRPVQVCQKVRDPSVRCNDVANLFFFGVKRTYNHCHFTKR
jgi:hypothetical protein